MFGGSQWGQQQNQQQPQQQQQGFGFGAQQQQQQPNTGFGQQPTTFGQPAQQQNTGGLFGGGQSTGFGAGSQNNSTFTFGANNNQAQPQQTNNAFGARPGFGATGGTTFGQQPAQNTTGGGLFGASTSTPAFGASNNTFGKPATSTFGTGQTSTLFGAPSQNQNQAAGGSGFGMGGGGGMGGTDPTQQPFDASAVHEHRIVQSETVPANGSAQPPYQPTWHRDPAPNANGQHSAQTQIPHLYHSIGAMLPYRGASNDELRMVDYEQNRKTADAPPVAGLGGFGQPAAGGFGQPQQQQQQAGGFGQAQAGNSLFGAPKPASTGLFGSTAPTNTGFGASTTGGGLFGGQQNTNTAGGGMFGQQNQQQSGGLFGATNNNNQQQPATGMFGQQQQQPQQQAGGLFQNPNPFGQTQQQQQQQPAAGGFSFGASTAAKPAFGTGSGTGTTGFGQTNTATTGFGQTNAQPAGTFNFGQNNQQQQQQPTAGGGLFGGTGGFGAPNTAQNASTGLFGANQQQQQPSQTGGLFGSTAAKPAGTGFFGAPAATATSTPFSLNQNQQQQPAPATGLFGAPTANPGTGLFGQNNQQQQQPAATGGLFGNTAGTGSNLFGAKPSTTPGTTTGLFGAPQTNQPATGSLFGAPNQSGGLFGSTTNTLGQSNQLQNNSLNKAPGGLFGGTSSTFGQPQQQLGASSNTFGTQSSTGGLFGGNQQQSTSQNNFGGSLFGTGSTLGQSQQQPQQQQGTLTASIDQNPYGNNPLFTYTGQTLDLGSQTKKPALPPLTSSTFRLTPSRKSQVNKLRGFASPAPSSPGRAGSPLSGLTTSGRSIINSPVGNDRYKGLADTVLPANAFVPRPSIKRLTVTPKSNGFQSSSSEDHLESVLGKSAIRSASSTPVPSGRSAPAGSPAAAPSPATLLFNPSGAGPSSKQAQSNGTHSTRPAGSDRQPKDGDYWCRPKLEKLKQLGDNDKRELHNFVAGRKGYGEVTFLEPVDVTGIDLDSFLGTVIVLNDMELIVYPDDYSGKPARGDGLNVPAQITLENCWTKDKSSKQVITDVNDPRHIKFLKRVKNIPDTEFVSWADGVWSFKVQHFSRYGLDADSDEDEGEGGGARARTSVKELEARRERERREARTPSGTPPSDEDDTLPPTKSRYDHDHDHDESGSEHDSGFEDGSGGSRSSSVSDESSSGTSESGDRTQSAGSDMEDVADGGAWDRPLGAQLGQEGMKKLKEMQAGFFSPAPAVTAAPRTTGVRLGLGRSQIQTQTQGTKRREQDFRSAGEDVAALDTRAVKRASFGEISRPAKPAKLRQPRKYARVSLEESVAVGAEGSRVDAGLGRGRSISAISGLGGQVVHLGKICGPFTAFASGPDASVFIDKVNLLAENGETERSRADRLLRLQLERSDIALIDGVPTATVDSVIRFADFAKLFDAGDRSHEANIFRLGQALFDEIDLRLPVNTPEDLVVRTMTIRRKFALSRWLEDAVAPAVDAELVKTESKPAKLFTLLSGNQVERAVQSAIEGNDLRLATLLSQASSSEDFRQGIIRQLEDWRKYKANSMISVEYRRVYALLAGITDISPGDPSRGVDGCPDVLISEDLDWKRAFGVQMWYGNPFEDDIPTVLDSYTSALSSATPPAKPLPPYLEKPSALEREWRMSTPPTDILFGLIRLFSDPTISLDQVLRSRDASPSPFDMRVVWHLYILLARVLAKRDFDDRDVVDGYSAQADKVTVGYASQLEGMGDWVGAAFVLMHLESANGREQALRALVHRHPDPTADELHRLTASLKLPVEWIHEAKAAQLASSGEVYAEYHELVKATLYERAHRILIGKLLPEVILRDDMRLLRELCGHVADKASGWEYGGKLFIDYADVCENVSRLLSSVLRSDASQADKSRLTDLARTVPRLIQLLPAVFPDREDVQQVAGLGDMLSNLHNLAGSLHAAGYIARPAVSSSMVDVDRIHLLQAAAVDSFSRSLAACVAAA